MDLQVMPNWSRQEFTSTFITKETLEENTNSLNKLIAQNHNGIELQINALKNHINQQEVQLNNFIYELQNKHISLDKKLQDYFDYNKEHYNAALELINSLDRTLTNQKQLLDILLNKNESAQEIIDKQSAQIENINAQIRHFSYLFSLRNKFEFIIGYVLLTISTFIFLFHMGIMPEWTSIIVLIASLFMVIRTITAHTFTNIEVIESDAIPEENI